MSLEPGTTLGPYSVTAKIGAGGIGQQSSPSRAGGIPTSLAFRGSKNAREDDSEKQAAT